MSQTHEGPLTDDDITAAPRRVRELEAELAQLRARQAAQEQSGEMLDLAWGLIANVDGGNWEWTQNVDWVAAAKRWREQYHDYLDAHRAPEQRVSREAVPA